MEKITNAKPLNKVQGAKPLTNTASINPIEEKGFFEKAYDNLYEKAQTFGETLFGAGSDKKAPQKPAILEEGEDVSIREVFLKNASKQIYGTTPENLPEDPYQQAAFLENVTKLATVQEDSYKAILKNNQSWEEKSKELTRLNENYSKPYLDRKNTLLAEIEKVENQLNNVEQISKSIENIQKARNDGEDVVINDYGVRNEEGKLFEQTYVTGQYNLAKAGNEKIALLEKKKLLQEEFSKNEKDGMQLQKVLTSPAYYINPLSKASQENPDEILNLSQEEFGYKLAKTQAEIESMDNEEKKQGRLYPYNTTVEGKEVKDLLNEKVILNNSNLFSWWDRVASFFRDNPGGIETEYLEEKLGNSSGSTVGGIINQIQNDAYNGANTLEANAEANKKAYFKSITELQNFKKEQLLEAKKNNQTVSPEWENQINAKIAEYSTLLTKQDDLIKKSQSFKNTYLKDFKDFQEYKLNRDNYAKNWNILDDVVNPLAINHAMSIASAPQALVKYKDMVLTGVGLMSKEEQIAKELNRYYSNESNPFTYIPEPLKNEHAFHLKEGQSVSDISLDNFNGRAIVRDGINTTIESLLLYQTGVGIGKATGLSNLLNKGGKIGKYFSDKVGIIPASSLLLEGDIQKENVELYLQGVLNSIDEVIGRTEGQKFIEGATEMLWTPEANLLKSVTKEPLQEFALKQIFKKSLGESLVTPELKYLIQSITKNLVATPLEESFEEVAGNKATDWMNQLSKKQNLRFNPEEQFTLLSNFETAVNTTLGMLPTMLFGLGKNYSDRHKYLSSISYEVGANANELFKYAQDYILKSKEEDLKKVFPNFVSKQQLIEKVLETNNDYKKAYEDASPITSKMLSESEKIDYFNTIYTYNQLVKDTNKSEENLQKLTDIQENIFKTKDGVEKRELEYKNDYKKALSKDLPILLSSFDYSFANIPTLQEISKSLENLQNKFLGDSSYQKQRDAILKVQDKVNSKISNLKQAAVELSKTPEQKAEENNQKGQITLQRPNLGNLNIELNTPYYLSTIEEVSTEGKKIKQRPLIEVIQDNGNGTVKVSIEGNVSDMPFEELSKYKFTRQSTVEQWKKDSSPEAFVFEHENDVFSYQFAKPTENRDSIVKGRIEYNPAKKSIEFVYKDKKGQIQRYVLSKSDLKDIKSGKLKYVRTLETEGEFNIRQAKMQEDLLKINLDKLQNQSLQRLEFITNFIEQKVRELTSTKELISKVEDQLLDTEIEMEKLQKQLDQKNQLTTKKGKTRVEIQKLFDKLNNLQNSFTSLQDALFQLEQQKQDLENQIEYTSKYEDVEFESKKSLVDQLIDDQFKLELQLEQVNIVISNLRDLISGIENTIKKIASTISNLVKGFQNKYGEERTTSYNPDEIRELLEIDKLLSKEYPDYTAFLSKNPEYLKNLAKFNELVNENLDKLDLSEKDVENLKQSIKANIDIAKNIQSKIKYQEELIAEAIKTREQVGEKKKTERIQNLAQEIYGQFVQKQSTTETGNEETDKQIEETEKESSKIDMQELFSTSTSGSVFGDNGLGNPAVNRLQTFLNTQSLEGLELAVITKDNAKRYGLESILFSDENTTNKTDDENDNDLVIAFVNSTTKQFVDVNGKQITDKTDLANRIIYTSIKKANLNWSNNQKNYTAKGVPSDKVEDLAKEYQKAHKELRQLLVDNSKGGNTVFLQIKGVSRGFSTGVETVAQPIQVAVPLPNNITLNNKQIVYIPTSQNSNVGQVPFQKGNINMPVGRPVLSIGQHFEFLKNKLFNKNDVDTFIKVFQHLYDNINNKKEVENILNFLGKTLYLRDPSKVSKTTGEQQESDKGNSQLWLTVDGNNNIIINFGKESSLPLSEIKTYKGVEKLLAFFVGKNQQGVYHNIDRAGLQDAKGNFLAEPFIEYYLDKSNDIKERQWNSYQEYLLSAQYPDGTNRPISQIPLTTTLQPSSETTPNKYGRYVIFDNPVTNKVTESVNFASSEDLEKAFEQDNSDFEPITIQQLGKPNIEEVGAEYLLSIYQDGNPIQNSDTLEYQVKFIKKNGEFWLDKSSVINNSGSPISLNAIQTSIMNSVSKNQQVSYVTFGKRNTTKTQTTKKEAPVQTTEQFTKPTGLSGFTKTLKKEEKTEDFKEQKENPTDSPTDNSIVPKISLLELRNKLKDKKSRKEYRVSESREYQPVNLQEAKKWWEERFPQIPFKVIQGLVDGIAWGAISDSAMLLSNVAEVGTEYHEAFEAVYKFFLTPSQKAKLNREFRNRKGSFKEYGTGNTIEYSKATDEQIKEQIAEEYREFELSGGKKKWNGEFQKNSLFRKIWNLIHDFLFNSRDGVNEVFEKISNARYKDKIPFATKHTTSDYRVAIKEENPVLFRELMNGVTNLLFQNLRGLQISIPEFLLSKNYNISEQYAGIKKDLEDFYGGEAIKEYISAFTSKEQFVNYHYVNEIALDFLQSLPTALQSNFVNKYDELTPEAFGNLYTALKTYENIDDNWEDIIEEHKKYLSIYSIEFQEDESVDTDEDNKNPTEYVDTLRLSRKNNANTEIKLLLATLIDKQFSKDYIALEGKKITPKDVTTKINSMFLSELVDYSATINKLLFKLAPATTYQDMIDILEREAKFNPTFLQILDALKVGVPVEQLSKYDMDLQTKFYKSLNNMRVEFIDLLVNSDLTGTTVELNEQNAIRLVKSKWQNALKQSGIVHIVKDEYKIDKSKLNVNSISKEGDIIRFLKSLDIDFNIAFSRLTQDEVETVLKSVQEIYKVLQTNTPEKLFKDDILTRKPLNDLASVYIKYSDFYSEPQHLNIEGEPEQNITLHNFVGMLSKVFNASKTLNAFIETIPQYALENNPYLYFSQIVGKGNNFFDSQGNRTKTLKLKIFGGTKDVNEQIGTPTSGQIEANYIAQEFSHNLEGDYYMLIPADTKREWGFNFGHFVTKSQSNNMSYIVDIMKKYLISEIYAARDSKNSNLKNVKNVGVKLRQFEEILKTVDSTFELDIDNDILPKEIVSQNETKVNEAISAYINGNVNKTLAYFRDNGIIREYEEQENEENTFSGFTPIKKTNSEPKKTILFAPKSIVKEGLTDSEIEELIRFREINYMFNIIEQYKFIWGDPAQWTDIGKRTKPYLSPRELSVHNNFVFNAWHNIFSNKKTWVDKSGAIQTLDLQPKDVGFVNYTDEMRVQTFSDVITVSENAEQLFEVLLNKTSLDLFNQPYSEIKKDEEKLKQVQEPHLKKGVLTNPYENNNEGDGQAFMFPSGEREIRQRATTWTEADEELYDYDMALFRKDNNLYSKDANGKKLKAYDNYVLSKNNPYVNSFVEDTKNAIRQVLKPIYSGLKNTSKFEQDIRKMSIAPLSWRSVKGTAFEKAYIEHVKANTTFINMESANKVGLIENIEDFYVNGQGNTNIQHEKLNFKYFGIQVETITQKEEATLGTQLTKLAVLNLMINGVPLDFIKTNNTLSKEEIKNKWKSLSKSEQLATSNHARLINRNSRLLAAMKIKAKQEVFNSFSIKEKEIDGKKYFEFTDFTKFEALIQRELNSREAAENIKKSARLNAIGDNFVLPFDLIIGSEKLESILTSMIDKALLRPKMYGGQMPQISSSILASKEKSRELVYKDKNGKWKKVVSLDKLTEKEKKSVRITSNDLKFYTPQEPWMEVMLPFYMKEFLEKGQELSISDIPEELRWAIGFRIPSQEINSAEHIKIKGFLPAEYGNSIVVPSEITTKAGSDFDIDKLNIYLYNYFINLKTGKPEKIQFLDNNNSNELERYDKYKRQNPIIKEIYSEYKDRLEKLNSTIQKSWEVHSGQLNKLFETKTLSEKEIDELFYLKKEKQLELTFNNKDIKELNDLLKDFERGFEEDYESTKLIANIFGYSGDAFSILNQIGLELEEYQNKVLQNELDLELIGNKINNLSLNKIKREDIQNKIEKRKSKQEELIQEKNELLKQRTEKINNVKPDISFEEFSKLPIELQNSKKAIDNAYVDNLRELLSLEENFSQLILPNSAKVLEDEAKRMNDLWQNTSSKKNFSSYLSSLQNAATRIAFLVGKKAVGIGAVGQTTHAIAQITGAEFSEDIRKAIKFNFPTNSTIEGNNRFYSFSDKFTKDGQQISSIISAFINAFVDIAKDPYIFYMNGNYTTAGIYITAFKLGMPVKETVLWFNQPVVREYIKLKMGREKLTNKEIGFKLADKFGFDVTDRGKPVITPRTEDYNVKELEGYIKEWVNQDVTILSQTEEGVTDTTPGLSQQFADNQGNLFAEFLKLESISWDLFNYAQAINHDTTRTTSLYSISLKMNDIAKGLSSPLRESILSALNETFIGTIVQSKNELLQATSPLYLTETSKARDILYPILSEIFQKRGSKLVKEELAKNIRKDFVNYILQVFPIEIGGKKMLLTSAIEELMKNNAIGNKLIPIQDKQNKGRLPENFFTKNLFSVKPLNKNGINNIFSLRRFSEKIDVDLAIADFLNLKNHPETDGFMIDLIKVALLQTGVKFSPKSFSQLIPTEEWEKIISQIKKQFEATNLFQTLQGFEASWYQNQWNNRELIQKAEVSKLNKKGEPMSRFRNWLKIKDYPPLLVYFAESPTDSSINSSNFTKQKYLIHTELKKDYSGAPLYSKKQREDMKRNGDYSFLTQILYKRLEIPNRKGFLDTPLFHDKIYNFPNHSVVFFPVNMYGKPGEVIENYQRQTPSKVNNPIPAFTDQEIYNKLQELGKPVGRFLSEKTNKDEDEDVTLSLENLLSLEQEANNAMNTNITLLEAKKPVAKPTQQTPIVNTPTEEVIEQPINIYSQLGNKTATGNVVIKGVYQQEGVQYAKSIGGVFSLRVNNSNKHFGNPFSSVQSEIDKGLTATKSTKESVEKYIDWVINSQDERAIWIKEQLKSGILKGKPIVYYKELGEPSHATALDYLINKYNWNVEQPTNKEIKPNEVKLTPRDLINHSGGAYGGDTFWDLIGREFGVTNHKHYKDAGNPNLSQQLRNKGVKAEILTKEQMDFARQKVKELLGIEYKDDLRGNLQVRNFYQVYNADAVYAVAKLDTNKGFDSAAVLGGTNTAVQLGIKLNKPVYVWDIFTEQWYKFNGEVFEKTETPELTKNFAGVGSRDIEKYNVQKDGKWKPREEYVGKEKEEKAKQAIRNVYQKTLNRPTEIKPKIEVVNRYSDSEVKANPDKIYVFGDNTDRKGTGGQAAIRNNPNAFGIATKVRPTNNENAFMSDKDLESNKKTIDFDIQKILDQNKPLVFPKDGFGTGLAKLKEKAPQTYQYLKEQLLEKFGFNNDTGELTQEQPIVKENKTNLPGLNNLPKPQCD